MTTRIAAVILAAGAARRLGQQKLLLPLAGQPLLAHVLAAAGQVMWADFLVIIGEPRDELAAVCDQQGRRWAYNPERHTGQASSIRAALAELGPDLDGFIFLPGDQPLLSPALLQAIVDRFVALASRRAIVVPQNRGQRRSPVLFGAAWRPCLEKLTGDEGGRAVLRDNPVALSLLDWPTGRSFLDLDTWADYRRLCEILAGLPGDN